MMAAPEGFQFDLDEEFPHLPSAPIVEAVIHWRARAENPWDANSLREQLIERLKEYPQCDPQRELRVQAQVDAEGSTQLRRESFLGFRLTSPDGRQIAQFNRDGLIFSRLEPYNDWPRFSIEGLRLWKIFLDLAAPVEVQRLGVRFINRIAIKQIAHVGRFLTRPPKCLDALGLPVAAFLYQSIHNVPDHPFQINVTQTIQPPDPPQNEGFGLILDIDVFTTQPFECNEELLEQHLATMRWMKDKAFFSLIKPKAIESFKKDRT